MKAVAFSDQRKKLRLAEPVGFAEEQGPWVSGQEAPTQLCKCLLSAEAPVPQGQAPHELVAGSQPCSPCYREPSVHGTHWELGRKGRWSVRGRKADFDSLSLMLFPFSLLVFPFASLGLLAPLMLIVSGVISLSPSFRLFPGSLASVTSFLMFFLFSSCLLLVYTHTHSWALLPTPLLAVKRSSSLAVSVSPTLINLALWKDARQGFQ